MKPFGDNQLILFLKYCKIIILHLIDMHVRVDVSILTFFKRYIIVIGNDIKKIYIEINVIYIYSKK